MRSINSVIFRSLMWSTIALIGAAAGCAGGGDTTTNVDYQEGAIEDHHHYRLLAEELQQMAERERIEADIAAQSPNADPKEVAQKRLVADKLAAMAADAEKKAHQTEQYIPHAVVPQ